jgi:hypothetical protein
MVSNLSRHAGGLRGVANEAALLEVVIATSIAKLEAFRSRLA